jgi:flagellar basal-body rod protein FlgC
MTDLTKTTMAVASSAMRAQSLRVRLAAENLANVDSPEYQRRTVQFDVTNPTSSRDVDFVAIKNIARDNKTEFASKYDPTNPMANTEGYVKMSNVNSLVEITDSKEANRNYEANLSMFEQARTMYSRVIDLLRS